MNSADHIDQSPSAGYRQRPLRELTLRVRRFFGTYGLTKTISRAFIVALNLDPYKRTIAKHAGEGNESIFSKIYELNLWNTAESRSGRGSTLL